MTDESPGWVHPPDELGVLVVVVHPRRRRRHESHGSRALTRINSFRHAAETKSERASAERPSYCSLVRRLVVPAWAGQEGDDGSPGGGRGVRTPEATILLSGSPDGVVTLMRSLLDVSAGVAKRIFIYGKVRFCYSAVYPDI